MTFTRDLAWQSIDLAYRSSVAYQFARYALRLNYELLPQEVVHEAKRCVLDALGCALGAYDAPGRPICEDTVKELGGKEDVKGKKMSILFEDLQARKVYVFVVVSVNGKGYPSAPSNPVQVTWDYSPQQPRVVNGERGDKKVDLSWEPVVGATGYNIYRRAEGEVFSINPLNRAPLTETRYTDLNVENEKKYVYTVRAVKRVVKTDVEGKGSLEFPVTPTDLIPPNVPTELVAVPLKNGMELNWRRNREPDLLGYNVYRRTVGEEELKKLTTDPIPKETFLDTGVELGQDYEYAVTAVDHSPRKNESRFSEEVRVKYIY